MKLPGLYMGSSGSRSEVLRVASNEWKRFRVERNSLKDLPRQLIPGVHLVITMGKPILLAAGQSYWPSLLSGMAIRTASVSRTRSKTCSPQQLTLTPLTIPSVVFFALARTSVS
jgi:hypothetical protein